MTTEAYPLCWPEGRPRTGQHHRERARFVTSFARARDDVIHQIELLVGRYQVRSANVVVSTNIALRKDGLPLASQRAPDDVGVAVYFTYKKRQMCFACDRWRKIEDNMQAIAKTIEALRGVARWGTGDMMEAAFNGFTALPAPGAESQWWQVLGLNNQVSADVLRETWKRLRSIHHPDRGGDNDLYIKLESAYKSGCAALGIERAPREGE